MGILIVVESPDRWPLAIPSVEVLSARSYLTDAGPRAPRGTVVFNLCRSYAYQSLGYYVSLLAEARGHRAQPSVTTLQDLRGQTVVRLVSEDLADLIQRSLAPIRSKVFDLSIYFGRNLAKRYQRLAASLFGQFRAPLLRARFVRKRQAWQLQSIGPIAAADIPTSHREFVVEAATAYFSSGRWSARSRRAPRYHLAILVDPDEAMAPSDEPALRRFERAAQSLDMEARRITRHDFARIPEFDALFIRTTTFVNHYTYRFARRADAEGLVVIDDPSSIIRCTNKVYLEERLSRGRVPMPKTLVVHQGNRDRVGAELGLPCVLKQPDSSFSRGVVKVDDEEALETELERMFRGSELLVAQQFLPTDYDWRVGVLDGKPLYVCRYFMARKHWQIIKHADDDGDVGYGRVETLPVEDAPAGVVRTAIKAARLIGDGLYGVDLKQSGRRVRVMEVNDNPNIDAGSEDAVLGRELYRRVLGVFRDRIEARRKGGR